jgi:hypothetical protein
MKNQASATSRAAGQNENRSLRLGFGLPAVQKDKLMAPDNDIWDTYPGDTVVDRDSMASRLETCSALERVWILALLGRCNEAVEEGQALLAGSTNRLFEEGKYRDAAAEFEWARDLFRS